jgi:hypothetical protein
LAGFDKIGTPCYDKAATKRKGESAMGASFPFLLSAASLKAAFIASSSAGLVATCQSVWEIRRLVPFVITAWPFEQRGRRELFTLPEKNARKQLPEQNN